MIRDAIEAGDVTGTRSSGTRVAGVAPKRDQCAPPDREVPPTSPSLWYSSEMDALLTEALRLLAAQVARDLEAADAARREAEGHLERAKEQVSMLRSKLREIEDRMAEDDSKTLFKSFESVALRNAEVLDMLRAGPSLPTRGWRSDVVSRVKRMLEINPFEWMQRSDIYKELVDGGVVFTAENPEHRLTQILSGEAAFENDRSKGWRLRKSEPPVAAGGSGATEPSQGTTFGVMSNEKGEDPCS